MPLTATSSTARADQVALIYDSPVTNTIRKYHVPGAARSGLPLRRRAQGPRRHKGRYGHHLHADDPAGRDRHARVRPARVRCIPWCSADLRRTNLRSGSTMQSRRSSSPPRAPSKGRRPLNTNPCWTRRSNSQRISRRSASYSSGIRKGVNEPRPRSGLGRTHGKGEARRRARRSGQRTRSISCIRRAPPGSPRALSGTTAATRWRSAGAWSISTA